MKFATYSAGTGATQAAVLDDGRLYPVPGAASVLEIIGDGLDALLAKGNAALASGNPVELESVRLEAPLQPGAMRDSMCFHEHIRNCLGEVDPLHRKFPAFYFTNPYAVLGPQDEAAISPGSEAFDYELEIAAVIGPPGSNLRPAEARDHIIGYTMYIDWSARDLQMEEMQVRLGAVKGKDGATTLGPVLASADELEPRRSGKGFDARMSVAIDGAAISSGNWNTINWSFDDVIAYTSRGTHLRTGDVIGSGTVGKGCLLEQRTLNPETFRGFLREGEVVTFEVDPIGRLDVRVAAPLPRYPLSSGH